MLTMKSVNHVNPLFNKEDVSFPHVIARHEAMTRIYLYTQNPSMREAEKGVTSAAMSG